MARIIGGLAVSHTPTIGFAVDHDKQEEAAWAPIFQSFEPIKAWLEERRPDVLFYIFNDHVTSFFFDNYCAFSLGVDDHYEVADEGGHPRDLPPIGGHAALARHIGESLMADEFDMGFFRDKPLDHGFFSPMSALLPHQEGWPVEIVPLQVGVLQFPVPSAARCYKLGQALGRAIESYPEELDVAIVATGGLSHQVHGERCGFNNPDWDAQFIDLLVNDPQRLTEMNQTRLPCLLMRGGTSKGAYFLADDLPESPALRDRVLLAAMGSPDKRQIDGIGGGDSLTSKVAIVRPSPRPEADVDYLFAQVVVDEPRGEVGVAAAIKMCRSVMIKGLEALTTECLSTARHYGAEAEVLASLHESFPEMGWGADLPHYLISRVAEHGRRRAEEMEEVADAVLAVGLEPHMSRAIVNTQRGLVDAMANLELSYAELEPFDWRELADHLVAARRPS